MLRCLCLRFGENKEYVRKVLKETGDYTAKLEGYEKVSLLDKNAPFFTYNKKVNTPNSQTPSHQVIEKHIKCCGTDYRYEDKQSPIPSLRDRKEDNITFGRE